MSKNIFSILLSLIVLTGCTMQNMGLKPQPTPQGMPNPQMAGIYFPTRPAQVPTDPFCLNKQGGGGFAKEIIHPTEGIVSVHGGSNPIPDEAWADFEPEAPYIKNQNLHSLFSDHCIYRSPANAPDCEGEACATLRTVSDYTWNDIAQILAQGCLPEGSTECSGRGAEPGSFAITILKKCQVLELADEIFVASDGQGNRYVVHATETGRPSTDAALPEGWTMERIEIDEPLQIKPFGEDSDCYHIVGHDNLAQLYTQFAFAEDVYPASASAMSWQTVIGDAIAETLIDQSVSWPGQGIQTWSADGKTMSPLGEGQWKVARSEYCSKFPNQDWNCFGIKISGDGTKLRVEGSGQRVWVGTFN